MDHLKVVLRLNQEVPNPAFDRRCKYGLGAHKAFLAGMLWVKQAATYRTPLGAIEGEPLQQQLEAHSTPDQARSVEELLFVHKAEWFGAADVLKHLVQAHDWTLSEVELVITGLAQEGSDAAGA